MLSIYQLLIKMRSLHYLIISNLNIKNLIVQILDLLILLVTLFLIIFFKYSAITQQYIELDVSLWYHVAEKLIPVNKCVFPASVTK